MVGVLIRFSIVIPVFNVEDYLHETINSVLDQDYNKDDFEVILIDDGSSDSSGAICDDYSKKERNVISIHIPNGGVSGARNLGKRVARGDLIGFLDSDDKYSRNVLSSVDAFYSNHVGEVDAIAIPRVYFEGREGESGLNYKFEKGPRVIDLDKEYTMIQNICTATFFVKESLLDVEFDKQLKYGEDTKFILQVLEKRHKLGVVDLCYYYYRKRIAGGSAVDSMAHNPNWYMPPLRFLTEERLNYYKSRNLVIPDFVQYTLMFELSWKIKEECIPSDILSDDEALKYLNKLNYQVKYISDKVIMKQKTLFTEHKLSLLKRKYKKPLDEEVVDGDVILKCAGKEVHRLSKNRLTLELMEESSDSIHIEGSLICVPPMERVKLYVGCGNNLKECEIVERDFSKYSLGELIRNGCGFKFDLKVGDEYDLKFYEEYGGNLIECKNIQTGVFFPVNWKKKEIHYYSDNCDMHIDGNQLIIQKKN